MEGVVSKWAYTWNRKSTSKQAIAVYDNKYNDHLREKALIFEQILSTNSVRKWMEISLENLCVDPGA